MPRSCSICGHQRVKAIDAALVENVSYRDIAGQYGVSRSALERHKEHLPAKLAKAAEAKEVAQADDLLQEVRALRSKAYSLLLSAEQAGDLRTALAGVREARATLELLARLVGELDQRPTVVVTNSPQWPVLVASLREVLSPHPTILAAVSARLIAMERDSV